MTERSNDLCQRLQRFRNGTTDDKSKPHIQALFEDGRDLVGMLALRDGWSFERWDAVSDSGSEESQMELLVFPGLLNSGEYVRHRDLGSGGKRGIGIEVKRPPRGRGGKGAVTELEEENESLGKLKKLFRQSTRKALSLADFINEIPDLFSD